MNNKKIPNSKTIWVYGMHVCDKILLQGKIDIKQIIISDKNYQKFSNKISGQKCKKIKPHEFFKFLKEDANHQGIAIEIDNPDYHNINDFISSDRKKLVILDQITDVGNVGAIIRSMLAFNLADLVITEHNSISNYGKLLKSSAGLALDINIYQVTNLNKLIETLKEAEFWCIGLDGSANNDISQIKKFEKSAIILGSEGKGIRDLVMKNCDLLVKIPMGNNVESLNVSNAAAITFYELSK